MGIIVTIDEKLAEKARTLIGLADASAAVEQILRDVTAKWQSPLQGMLELAGTNPLRDDYDYKALRAGGNDVSGRMIAMVS